MSACPEVRRSGKLFEAAQGEETNETEVVFSLLLRVTQATVTAYLHKAAKALPKPGNSTNTFVECAT